MIMGVGQLVPGWTCIYLRIHTCVSCMSCMLGACVQARLEAKHDKELWAVAEQVKELLGTRGWR